VCTTELGAVAKLGTWSQDIAETQGAQVDFPLIADSDPTVATLYGMIHPNASETATVRSVFITAPRRTVRLTMTYPASTAGTLARSSGCSTPSS
jgi:alkyl hydroperoxide reductase subunit AhpC